MRKTKRDIHVGTEVQTERGVRKTKRDTDIETEMQRNRQRCEKTGKDIRRQR